MGEGQEINILVSSTYKALQGGCGFIVITQMTVLRL